eukprot:TRINITY_DN8308_c0_g1_i1.p1 TRINITY_DN8308_c0_g1~~TRINITY_DN8308_c0_g1_i1.p1  ORF type:complete len:444 (-),score=85.47 TRINITY_DN8308_c0_g1_i1:462-1718(-)
MEVPVGFAVSDPALQNAVLSMSRRKCKCGSGIPTRQCKQLMCRTCCKDQHKEDCPEVTPPTVDPVAEKAKAAAAAAAASKPVSKWTVNAGKPAVGKLNNVWKQKEEEANQQPKPNGARPLPGKLPSSKPQAAVPEPPKTEPPAPARDPSKFYCECGASFSRQLHLRDHELDCEMVLENAGDVPEPASSDADSTATPDTPVSKPDSSAKATKAPRAMVKSVSEPAKPAAPASAPVVSVRNARAMTEQASKPAAPVASVRNARAMFETAAASEPAVPPPSRPRSNSLSSYKPWTKPPAPEPEADSAQEPRKRSASVSATVPAASAARGLAHSASAPAAPVAKADADETPEPPAEPVVVRGRAKCDSDPELDGPAHLQYKAGDTIVLVTTGSHYCKGELDGKQGLVLRKHLDILTGPLAAN